MGTGRFIGWWRREFGASSPKTFLGLCCTKWYTSCFLVGNQRPVHGPSSFLVKNQRQVLGSGACSTLNARCTSLFCSGLCTRRSLVLWTGRLGGTTQDWCGRRTGERGVISLGVPHVARCALVSWQLPQRLLLLLFPFPFILRLMFLILPATLRALQSYSILFHHMPYSLEKLCDLNC